MIDYLKGKLISKDPTTIVLEVNGIAFRIKIPVSTFNSISKGEIKIFTHFSFKNEKMEIYGFATPEEKSLFEDLISVQGIGSEIGLRILSNIRIKEFKSAIAREDKGFLSKTKGIGTKTAERLIFALRGRYKEEMLKVKEDAISALVSLGFKRDTVVKVVEKIDSKNLEEILKEALKRL